MDTTPTSHRLDSKVAIRKPGLVNTLDQFFQNHEPHDWLLEKYAEATCDDTFGNFYHGLTVIAAKKWPYKVHFYTLLRWYRSDAGLLLEATLRARLLARRTQQLAAEKKEAVKHRLTSNVCGDTEALSQESSTDSTIFAELCSVEPFTFNNIFHTKKYAKIYSDDEGDDDAEEYDADEGKKEEEEEEEEEQEEEEQEEEQEQKEQEQVQGKDTAENGSDVNSGAMNSQWPNGVHTFFSQPASVWKDVKLFCEQVIEEEPNCTPRKALKEYRKSLELLSKVRLNVKQAKAVNCGRRVRWCVFKETFQDTQASTMRTIKRRKTNATVNDSSYHLLWADHVLSSDSQDRDYPDNKDCISLSQASTDSNETGIVPPPTPSRVDSFVGPGEFSSKLHCNHRVMVAGIDVSSAIMDFRRQRIIKAEATNLVESLLINFIVTKDVVECAATWHAIDVDLDILYRDPKHRALSQEELVFVSTLCAKIATQSFDVAHEWVNSNSTSASPLFKIVSRFFEETNLWSNFKWDGQDAKEDTFINALIKPLLMPAFGGMPGCLQRWTRDKLAVENAGEKAIEFPDFQLCYSDFVLAIGEFKTPAADKETVENDYKKLAIMGKRCVDALFAAGYTHPVTLLHGSGLSIRVLKISLVSEAYYKLEELGTFRLVSSPQEFGLLLSIGPLFHARDLVSTSLHAIKKKLKAQVDQQWLRGTFDCKGITVPA